MVDQANEYRKLLTIYQTLLNWSVRNSNRIPDDAGQHLVKAIDEIAKANQIFHEQERTKTNGQS